MEKRRIITATILITGVTGAVGSCLAPLLKSRGHRLICLVRSKDDQDAASRSYNIFGKVGKDVIVWDGDITLPLAGISGPEKHRWKGRVDKIVHCAASIRFDNASAKLTALINIEGTNNILGLARELEIHEIHHISTIYVAGDADYFRENDFDIGQTCRNIYERTKKEAERLVRNWRYGKYSIYRLGIVVGNSVTGFIADFNGYYRPFAFFWFLQQKLKRRAKATLEKYKAEGLTFDRDGMFILPIWINCSPVSTLNIIPSDWASVTLSNLIEIPADGKTFHIVHPNPPQIRWVTDVSLKHLGIKGYHYGMKADCAQKSLFRMFQKGFDSNIKNYQPYITHESKFETINAAEVLRDRYLPPPDIEEAFLATLLNYAKSVNFGEKEQY